MTSYVNFLLLLWQMELPLVWLMLLPVCCGRWNYHFLADVIANMADGIAICV